MTVRTLVVVPMKDPKDAKTRLAGALSSSQRTALARLLFDRTLNFLAELRDQAGFELSVVTGSDEIASSVGRLENITVIPEGPSAGLSEAVGASAAWATAQGFSRLCVVPADIAAPLKADVLKLLESPAAVTICPSADQGTNALLVSPPDAIEFCYGPRSAHEHHRVATQNGLPTVLMPLESLSYDIDTTAHLARALTSSPGLSRAMGAR